MKFAVCFSVDGKKTLPTSKYFNSFFIQLLMKKDIISKLYIMKISTTLCEKVFQNFQFKYETGHL
jgi:hypothetical protein